jgi:hypothetical protein
MNDKLAYMPAQWESQYEGVAVINVTKLKNRSLLSDLAFSRNFLSVRFCCTSGFCLNWEIIAQA